VGTVSSSLSTAPSAAGLYYVLARQYVYNVCQLSIIPASNNMYGIMYFVNCSDSTEEASRPSIDAMNETLQHALSDE
jgi:hypothetical protein